MTVSHIVHEKAERIRDVIRYLRRFKNALIVIYIDDKILESSVFLSHIKDISLIHEACLKLIIVPGAAKRIDEILKNAHIEWSFHEDCRITDASAMPLIKMAAFDVSNHVMTALAGEKIPAVIGNWVRARGKGVIDGFDYGTIGEVDKLQINSIKTVLDNGFIPIFPCIGWSITGKPYNISSVQLAEQIAVHLQADKLFYIVQNASINSPLFDIPKNIGTSPEGTIPALNLEELDAFVAHNQQKKITDRLIHFTEEYVSREKIFSLLYLAKQACLSGVTRVHILNGSLDGAIPCEIFSDFGSGTMVYANNYGNIRNMNQDDIPAVLSLMRPFIESGTLLPRTTQSLAEQCPHYIVYEIDGAIRACSALIPYDDGQMEIAAVAVDRTCSHIGIGPKMISFLVNRAKERMARSIFLLTTRTMDWFENFGFSPDSIESLPEKRRIMWNTERGSKVLRLNI